jgi:homospermidine synthase
MTTRYCHHDRSQHTRFITPIAMSFGSIGKGTLPLIERYIAFVLTTFFIFFVPPAGQAG